MNKMEGKNKTTVRACCPAAQALITSLSQTHLTPFRKRWGSTQVYLLLRTTYSQQQKTAAIWATLQGKYNKTVINLVYLILLSNLIGKQCLVMLLHAWNYLLWNGFIYLTTCYINKPFSAYSPLSPASLYIETSASQKGVLSSFSSTLRPESRICFLLRLVVGGFSSLSLTV